MGTIGSRFVLPCCAYFAVYVLATWPAILLFPTHFFGDSNDTLQNVWNLWWLHDCLVVRGASPYFTDLLFHPEGVSLVVQTMSPCNGLLGIVLWPFLGEHAIYNTLVVLGFVLGGWTTSLLALHLGARPSAAWFAGALFAFSHYHFAHAAGHMQLQTVQWLPLFVLAFLRFVAVPTWRRGGLAGLALVLVAMTDWYYVFYCVILGTVVYLVRSRQRGDLFAMFRAGARGGYASFLALVVPPLLTFALAVVRENRRDPYRTSHDALEYSCDLLAAFVPGGTWRFGTWTEGYWQRLSGNIVESSVYLGYGGLLVALWGFVHRRRLSIAPGLWLGLAAGFWLLSLGPVLQVAGIRFTAVLMPYRLLEVLVPPLSISGCPVRMMVMVTLGVALAAGLALPAFLQQVLRRWPLRLAFFAFLVFELAPWPQATTRIDAPDFVTRLQQLPPGMVHVEVDKPSVVLYHQTRHGHPLLLGYPTRIPNSHWDREGHVAELLAAKEYTRLFARYGLRYLVLENAKLDAAVLAQLRPVFLGVQASIFVLPADPLPRLGIELPCGLEGLVTLAQEAGAAGTLRLRVQASLVPDRPYLCLFSLPFAPDSTPETLLQDPLLRASLDPRSAWFTGHHGNLDAHGSAVVEARFPEALGLAGRKVQCVVLVLSAAQSPKVCWSSPIRSFLVP